MNWYIGQRVVAVFDTVFFKKGTEFTIKGIKKGECSCNHILINVGATNSKYDEIGCTTCSRVQKMIIGEEVYLLEKCFAPLQSRPDLSETTYDDIMREIEELTPQTV